jgi:hypothetical protein
MSVDDEPATGNPCSENNDSGSFSQYPIGGPTKEASQANDPILGKHYKHAHAIHLRNDFKGDSSESSTK